MLGVDGGAGFQVEGESQTKLTPIESIRRIGSARAVLIGTQGPVLTIFFGWWLLAEPISLAQLVGAGLVLAGVLLVSRR